MIQKLEPFDDYHRPNSPTVEDPELFVVDSESEVDEVLILKNSLRSRRKIFTLAVTGFVLGAMLILFNSSHRNEFLAPGPLSSNHAQILNGQGADRCAACHEASRLSLASWVTSVLGGKSATSVNQSDLCMKCHSQSLIEEFARKPHNMDPHKLSELTKQYSAKIESVGLEKKLGLSAPVNHNGDIACSACHREHHGGENLSVLTDKQCQSCHRQDFQSFELGHPEFSNWPSPRRSSIAFDHNTHALKHYPGAATKFNCKECHIDDRFQNVKKLAPYKQTCAKCHDDQIVAGGSEGLNLISLPMLDLDAIQENGLSIGQWPQHATGDFDGAIPPIMRLMLSADPQARAILMRLGPAFEFGDIDPGDPDQVADACRLAWSIKYLMFDLSQSGQKALRERIEVALGRSMPTEQAMAVVGDLNEFVFRAAIDRWMPRLVSEVPLHRAGQVSRQQTWIPDMNEIVAFYGGAAKDTEDDELATNPLTELMHRANSTPKKSNVTPMTPNPFVNSLPNTLPNSRAIQNDSKKRKEQRPQIDGPVQTVPIAPEELLAENPLQRSMPRVIPGQPVKDLDPIQENETEGDGTSHAQSDAAGTVFGADQKVARIKNPSVEPNSTSKELPFDAKKAVSAIVGAKPNGWTRNDSLLQINYRPKGHADGYVKAWLEVVTETPGGDERSEIQPLFQKLTSSTGIGMCRACHTVDQLANDSFEVNWMPKLRDPGVRSFTRFSHGPHLVQPQLQDCSACHKMDESHTNADSFTHFDSTNAVSNFAPITKLNCVNCHGAGQTSSRCTTCHSYHIGSRVTGNN